MEEKFVCLKEAVSIEDFKFVHEVETDPEVIHFCFPNFQESDTVAVSSYQGMYDDYKTQENKVLYIVWFGQERAGSFGAIRNFSMLAGEKENTAWISLAFAKKYHGSPLIKEAYENFEDILRNSGYNGIELGVFDFNLRGIKFYEKMGYRKIKVLENFTYYNGKWRSDIRYVKSL